MRKDTLVVVTLMGLLFYGGGLLVYSRFYETFGVSPDEVGLSYTAALTHLVPAFVLWLWAWIGVLLTLAFFVFFLSMVIGPIRQRVSRTPDLSPRDSANTQSNADANTQEEKTDSLWSRFLAHWVEVSVAVAGVLIVLFVVSALYKPGRLTDRVRRGEEVRPILDTNRLGWWPDAIWRNPFRIRVEQTRVWPTSPGTALPGKLRAGTKLAYLGRTADTIILYDHRHGGRTLRIPATLVVLSDAVS